jgi:hypothetical protein
MFALHAEYFVGPAEVARGDLDARVVLGAGGASVVARVVFEERFRGRAAPLIARAEEEELGFHADVEVGLIAFEGEAFAVAADDDESRALRNNRVGEF